MRIINGEGINHPDGKGKRGIIYSLDVQPGNFRLATAGGDCTARLWALNLFLDDVHAAGVKEISALLAILSGHTKSVNVVRWSCNGQYLASAGDDGYILVHTHTPNAVSNQVAFGQTSSPPKEIWSTVCTCQGHSMDILDIAWSVSGLIASASVDNSVLLWSIYSQDRFLPQSRIIHPTQRLLAHTSFVRGVSFDPWGASLVSVSDDHTICVWEQHQSSGNHHSEPTMFMLSKTLTGPLENASSRVPFRRSAFSPDGSALCVPSTQSNNGFSATLLKAQSPQSSTGSSSRHNSSINNDDNEAWETLIQFVSQSATMCSRFCPMLLYAPPSDTSAATSPSLHALVAIGEQSGTLSLWSSLSATPWLVLQQAGSAPICDVTWWIRPSSSTSSTSSTSSSSASDEVFMIASTLAGEVVMVSLSPQECTPTASTSTTTPTHPRGVVRDVNALQQHFISINGENTAHADSWLHETPYSMYLDGNGHSTSASTSVMRSVPLSDARSSSASSDTVDPLIWHPLARLYHPASNTKQQQDVVVSTSTVRQHPPRIAPVSSNSQTNGTVSASSTAQPSSTQVESQVGGKKRIRPVLLQQSPFPPGGSGGSLMTSTSNDGMTASDDATGQRRGNKQPRRISFASSSTSSSTGVQPTASAGDSTNSNGHSLVGTMNHAASTAVMTLVMHLEQSSTNHNNASLFTFQSRLPPPRILSSLRNVSSQSSTDIGKEVQSSAYVIPVQSLPFNTTSSNLPYNSNNSASEIWLQPCTSGGSNHALNVDSVSMLSLRSRSSSTSSLNSMNTESEASTSKVVWERTLRGSVSVIRAFNDAVLCIGYSTGQVQLLSVRTALPLCPTLILGSSVVDLDVLAHASSDGGENTVLWVLTSDGSIDMFNLTWVNSCQVNVQRRHMRIDMRPVLWSVRSQAQQFHQSSVDASIDVEVQLDRLLVKSAANSNNIGLLKVHVQLSVSCSSRVNSAGDANVTTSPKSHETMLTGSGNAPANKKAISNNKASSTSVSAATTVSTSSRSNSSNGVNGHQHTPANAKQQQQQQQQHSQLKTLWWSRQHHVVYDEAMGCWHHDNDAAGGGIQLTDVDDIDDRGDITSVLNKRVMRQQSAGDVDDVERVKRMRALSCAEERLGELLPRVLSNAVSELSDDGVRGAVNAAAGKFVRCAIEAGAWNQLEQFLCLLTSSDGGGSAGKEVLNKVLRDAVLPCLAQAAASLNGERDRLCTLMEALHAQLL